MADLNVRSSCTPLDVKSSEALFEYYLQIGITATDAAYNTLEYFPITVQGIQ